jgi:hypothetical protein
MSQIPHHHERQFLQYLRGRSWVSAIFLPPAKQLVSVLLEKGWIESQGLGNGRAYRITEKGLAAKKAPIPNSSYKSAASADGTRKDL